MVDTTVTQLVHTAGLSPVQASVEAILRVDLAGVAYALEEFGGRSRPKVRAWAIASKAGWHDTGLRSLPVC